jgi:hypothetical protein
MVISTFVLKKIQKKFLCTSGIFLSVEEGIILALWQQIFGFFRKI